MQPAVPGRVLGGRYRLLDFLARGGMASVWIGEDTLLARRVAVKTLHPELSGDDALRARFRNEAISSASVEDARIVGIYDTGEDDGVAYIVMEFVEGQDIRHLLAERGPLSPTGATRIARDVAAALDHAHRAGLVHRDIKPANVLVSSDQRIKVTDFGIAKSNGAQSDLTSTGVILGTARYLAPEQVRGDPVDARADIYAVGLLLYEMLTGRLPFRGDTDMSTALARLSTSPDPLPPGVPSPVAAIVERCLAVDPAHRYANAGDLAAALDAAGDEDLTVGRDITATLAPSAPRSTRPGPASAPRPASPPPRRRHRGLTAFLVLALLAAGAAAVVLLVPGLTSSTGGSARPGPGVAPLQLVAAKDFDPLGDGQEVHQDVQLAIDGNLKTVWPTETYNTRDFGHGKSGVGIYVTVAQPSTISTVTVDTAESGWNAQIYAATTASSSAPSTNRSSWGRPLATGANLSTHAQFTLRPPTRARVVLLWLTYLPPGGRLDVAEIQVR
ncbi:MAG TPA: protein kinase [Acidimicrobiia bacterium]|nr:protein kinase [Acidimicrobiia bacterium]